jgi:hypothetical protein
MLKKICSLLILVVLIASFSLTGFAADGIIKITRPDGDETTFKQSYVICGNTTYTDVSVAVKVYNPNSGEYIPLATVEGEQSFRIGDSGFFMKEVKLQMGANKIRVYAYNGENSQVNEFTITVLEESIKDKIKDGLFKITDMFKEGFKKLDPQ